MIKIPKNIAIKLLLTIPALLIGIMNASILILKPVIKLWFPDFKINQIEK